LSLDDAQVSELLANLERQDEEEFAEYAERTPDEQHKRREKQLRRLFERFTGRLAPEQRALIAAYVRASPEPVEAWRAARANWRGELAATLEERADTPEFRARMHRLIATPDELWTEDYRHRLAEGRERFLSLLLELDRTLSPAQRASTRRELLALAGEVEKLIHA
jgi:hypothetical protein